MKKILPLLILSICLSCGSKNSPAAYVDPFIGTDGHGHTFPGATLPFGFVQMSPDTDIDGWDWCSGYHSSDNSIMGFSLSHLSGTGAADLGDILFMPVISPMYDAGPKDDPDSGYRSRFSHDSEKAEPGYYSVYLDDAKTSVELTATQHTGIQRYVFNNGDARYVVLDLAHGIQDQPLDACITKVSDNVVEGYRRSTGWADDHTVFFHAEFSAPISSLDVRVDSVMKQSTANGKNVVAVMQFPSQVDTLLITTGISYVDIDGAKNNLQTETCGKDFETLRLEAYNRWNEELSKVYVSGPQDRKTIFYTALYHSMVAPYMMSDVDGRYRSSNRQVYSNSEPNYGLFSTWDTFRALHPLMTIVNPATNNYFVKSMIRYYEESGRLPVWDLNMRENFCMIGYHSIPIIVDAYFKGAEMDAEKALEAMVHSATEDSYQGLGFYRHYHYMPSDMEPNSVSKALEMSYDDWCIAKLAKVLGKDDIYGQFIERAQYYKNHLDPKDNFMKGRDSHGRFRQDFSPTQISILGQSDFTEGNSWHYSFFVPQDINTLISLDGGDEKFVEKLEELFNSETETNEASPDVSGMIGNYAQGNEPSHHAAYLYAYAGEQWRTAYRVNQICSEMFTTSRDGLCGNEDCGQMSAWYAMSAMGFYEVTPGSCDYVLGSPQFDTVRIGNFALVAENRSDKNIYIASATWNGQPYTKSYITHDMISGGGTLVLKMQASPEKSFGTNEEDRPHSVITDNVKSSAELLENVAYTPYVDVEERFFTDSIVVTPKSEMAGGIFYSVNGASAKKVSGSITLKGDCKLSMVAENGAGVKSCPTEIEFHNGRIPEAKIEYPSPAKQYSADASILTDGLSGGKAYSSGGWLGWNGGDITIKVTLPSERHISSIGVDFLAAVENWIALPSGYKVQFEKADGTSAGTAEAVIPFGSDRELRTAFFSVDCNVDAAAFSIVLPKNTIPAWHRSHDKPAWIFIDEIVVR